MVGHALKRVIPEANFVSSAEFGLRCDRQTAHMFATYKPKYVIHLAAKVGGIKANMDNLGDFYTENILINTNVLQSAKIFNVDCLSEAVGSLKKEAVMLALATHMQTYAQHDGA